METASIWPSQTAKRQSTTEPHDIAAGLQPFAVTGEVQRLQAERGEGGVAAEDAGHDELARRRAGEDAAVRARQRGEEADDERAEHVHEQRAPGEGLAEQPRCDARAPIACDPAKRAAERDPQIKSERERHQAPSGMGVFRLSRSGRGPQESFMVSVLPSVRKRSGAGKTKPAWRRVADRGSHRIQGRGRSH